MKFIKLNNFVIPKVNCLPCSYKIMGSILEITIVEKINKTPHILKIDKNHYCKLSSGEIFEFTHTDSRMDNKASVSKSLKSLRELINTNIIDYRKVKWITLTYSENMTNEKRLYKDFKNFIEKFRRHYGKCEYIVACEPQGRGAWHMHLLIIFNKKAPFIENNELEKLWKFGFTKTQNLSDNIDNIGSYLTAYLGDMEITDYAKTGNYDIMNKKIKYINDKKYIKGGRLNLYPVGFHLYRCSKGIKKPIKYNGEYNNVLKKFSNPKLVYSSCLKIEDNSFNNSIIYQQYNLKR